MRFVITVFSLLAVFPTADALTVDPMTFEQLVEEATAVVYGRVADVRGRWTSDRRSIESLVTLDVLRSLKGDLGDGVALRVPGGEAGGMLQLLPGAPAFREGDLVVAFLGWRGPSVPTLVGLTQGVFRVVVDRHTGIPYVTPPPLKASVAGRVLRGAADRHTLTIDAFASEVRSLLEARR